MREWTVGVVILLSVHAYFVVGALNGWDVGLWYAGFVVTCIAYGLLRGLYRWVRR